MISFGSLIFLRQIVPMLLIEIQMRQNGLPVMQSPLCFLLPPPGKGPERIEHFSLMFRFFPQNFFLSFSALNEQPEIFTGHDLLRLSGGENVVSSLQRSGTVSAEAIIHGDPEVIFVVDGFTSPDELARRSGWGEISAVRNRRVFTIDRKYLVPGYDPAGAIREMSLHLHSPRKQ